MQETKKAGNRVTTEDVLLKKGFAHVMECRAVLPPGKTCHPPGVANQRHGKLEECLRKTTCGWTKKKAEVRCKKQIKKINSILGPLRGQGHFWAKLVRFEPFWGLPGVEAMFGRIWSVLDHFGALPGAKAIFGQIWSVLIHFGASPGSRPFLVKFGAFWLDNFRSFLAHFGQFWAFWTIVGSFWSLPGAGRVIRGPP